MRKLFILVLVLIVSLPQPVLGTSGPNIKITEVYYQNSPGCEYIAIENWGADGTVNNIRLSDGEGSLSISNLTINDGEELYIAEDSESFYNIWHRSPSLVYDDFDRTGHFNLAIDGDELSLYIDNTLADAFYYERNNTGEGWIGNGTPLAGYGCYSHRKEIDTDTSDDWNWTRKWKVGHSSFKTEEFKFNGRATMYCAPDTSYNSLVGFLDGVDTSLKVSIYELSSRHIAEKIANLSEMGVDVQVLVQGTPVAGLTENSKFCLSMIEDSGGEVFTIGRDEYSPYNHLHCKYIIADNQKVLISSENFGYTGYPLNPTYGNRGWGVIIENEGLADYYSEVFDHDIGWGESFDSVTTEYSNSTTWVGYHTNNFEPLTMEGSITVSPVLSPDTSKRSILDLIDSAEDSIYIQQFYIKQWVYKENPFITHIIKAAERGVDVKIILDDTWYNIDDNETDNDDMVIKLNNIADENNLDLKAKLICREHGFAKVHNKGMIVDEEKVLVSSINWNHYSVLQNREVGVVLENKKIGSYYSEIFLSDWRDDITSPVADAGGDIEVHVGDVVDFYGKYSWDDNNITKYKWDIDGDGRFEKVGEKHSKVFHDTGEYNITLYVEDQDGNWDKDSVHITVKEKGFSILDGGEKQPVIPVVLVLSMIAVTAGLAYWKNR